MHRPPWFCSQQVRKALREMTLAIDEVCISTTVVITVSDAIYIYCQHFRVKHIPLSRLVP